MGYALAEAAKHYGGEVTLISGPVSLDKISGIIHKDIISANDMKKMIQKLLPINHKTL